MNFERAAKSRMALAYEFLPRIENAGRPTRTINILIAHPTLNEGQIGRLATIELLRLYLDELRHDIDLQIEVLVPNSFAALLTTFERVGSRYRIIDDFSFADPQAVHDQAKALDCGVVLVSDKDAIQKRNTDDYTMITDDVPIVLRECELLAKGFDAPWSFESPTKDAPWAQFYLMYERSSFGTLFEELQASKSASEAVYETMRILIHTLQTICYCRDRMGFYRQQDRWAKRAGLERQKFEFEYATYLNLFYLGLYSAVDQVAGLVVRRLGLNVPADQIGATYAKFRNELKAHPIVFKIFDDEDFWEWYGRVKAIRHDAAHNGLHNPLTIYDDVDFSEEQVLKAATEAGLLDEVERLPEFMRPFAREMALFRAGLLLRGEPIRHVLIVQNVGKTYLYNPDPHSEFLQFLSFFSRVLEQLKPWQMEAR